ncbi:MAG: UvrY/SirA/GacA family response regulator transcription factor [Spongiibacteraceae bacterium]
MITVLVADDHNMVRAGIVRMLDDAPDISVIAQFESGEEAIDYCRNHSPMVIVMDVRMPGMGGLAATRTLARVSPDSKILAVSACDREPMPSRLMQAGAAGYITKDASAEEIVSAVRIVARGNRYLSADIAQTIALKKFDDDGGSPFFQLSDREMQITMLIASCKRVQEIADELHISAKTVNSYRYRVFEKLDVNGDVELTHMAIRHGLIDLSNN